ncbi:MAG TPA: anthranilate synthase component I family protein [Methanophagales archaeon]|nr:anthranilate synthase component I family protein [Methanophagales archaeon]
MFVIQACEEIPFANPCLIYDILKKEGVSDAGEAYLLESREGDEKMARYSIIGFDPAFKFAVKDGILKTKSYNAVIAEAMDTAVTEDINPLSLIKAFLNELKIEGALKRERFVGGFVGYLSYDFIRYFLDLDESTLDTLEQPDCEFLLTNKNVIVDHRAKKAFFISNEFCDTPNNGMDLDATCVNLVELLKEAEVPDIPASISVSGDFRSNMEKADYERSVRAAKEYIRAGDIFQVVLSQRLEADFAPEGHFEFYKVLSEVNPSPYMYLLDFGERKIVGASPEMLVRVAGLPRAGNSSRKVESCPIAGTRRRGINKEEDKRLEVEMLNDEKERAEHLMLVDLSRNDIGKVSEFGTVKATRFMYPEKYSHVQHIVTDVIGGLRTDKDEFDALEATFPAGTVSGAPKVRAMEIIEELEPTRRGVYAGCVGYFSFNRSMDTAITIRTAVFEHGKVYIQAGAGIVADSDPEREYKETLSKCAALLACISGGERKK